MTVYVDDCQIRYRRMKMCHLFATTEEELKLFAKAIGVDLRHIQRPPKAKWVHFDICQAKRAKAVKFGATEVTRREAVIFRSLQARNHPKPEVRYEAKKHLNTMYGKDAVAQNDFS